MGNPDVRISTLIREGSQMYPTQAYRSGIKGDAACVRGAAHAAYANRTGEDLVFDAKGRCESVYKMNPLNSALNSVMIGAEEVPEKAMPKLATAPPFSLKRVITVLNDEVKWSREEIAQWIEENHDTTVKSGTHS